jgi:protein gp37
MENTKIAWTEHSHSWWIGCTEVSAGCDHCFARVMAAFRGWAKWGDHPRHRTGPAKWREPFRWERRAAATGKSERVFCNCLSDFFDNQVDPAWRAEAWDIIRRTPHLIWLILTKRPQNIRRMLPPDWGSGWPHVWLGVSVENMTELRRRIPVLLRVPAVKRFISSEPLLEPLFFGGWLKRLDWVIVGGESGGEWRYMNPDWARGIRDQCDDAGTAFFMKQMSAFHPQEEDIPLDLMIREWPE